LKNITFRQLRVFNAVARHLSFAKAAETLHVSAPEITMQIKDLEAEVGMPLFERQERLVMASKGF
jgi:DNA-binding transcriptional LysR family regulator